MDAPFDEDALFGAIDRSGARVLLIGRRAMVALGIPVLTADYDLWVHFDDIEALNQALAAVDHRPNRPPDEARARGRYVLENDEHIDVMVARAATAPSGERLAFEDAWPRRERVLLPSGVGICVPCVADLVLTKRWGSRPKDVTDIQLLEALLRTREKS